jgi:hypothetical protein
MGRLAIRYGVASKFGKAKSRQTLEHYSPANELTYATGKPVAKVLRDFDFSR